MPQVLLVPGFGGSELRTAGSGGGGGARVWLSPPAILAVGVAILALNDDGTAPFYPFYPPLIAGPPIDRYYPPIIDSLSRSGWEVITAALDWRLPVAANAPGLADLIEGAGAVEPVRVVAHSRGGLAVAAALGLLASRGTLGRVRQLVTLATPWHGSYSPLAWLGGWPWRDPEPARIWTVPGWLLSAGYLRPLLRAIVVTLPGLYECLPDPFAAALHGDPLAAGLYDPAVWSASGVAVSAGWIAAALARWEARPQLPSGVRLNCIVGYGLSTYAGPVDTSRLGDPACLPNRTDGDGVVPTWSGSPTPEQALLVPAGHQELLSDPAALAVLDGLLRT